MSTDPELSTIDRLREIGARLEAIWREFPLREPGIKQQADRVAEVCEQVFNLANELEDAEQYEAIVQQPQASPELDDGALDYAARHAAKLEKILVALVDCIEDYTTVKQDPDGDIWIAAHDHWYQLAEVYRDACQAVGREPKIKAAPEEVDPADQPSEWDFEE